MEPLTVYPIVYVLACEDDCYYVGSTMDFNKRWAEHVSGRGSNFTKLHKPLRVVEIIIPEGGCLKREAEVARQYIDKFGRESVAGGGYK